MESVPEYPTNPIRHYREHFAHWATKLRNLEIPKLSEEQIVSNIAGHYPGYLRVILISVPERSIINSTKILGTEEHRRSTYQDENRNQGVQHSENNGGYRPPPRENNGENRVNIAHNRNYNPHPREGRRNNNQREPVNEEIPQVTENSEHVNHVLNNILTNHQSVDPYIS